MTGSSSRFDQGPWCRDSSVRRVPTAEAGQVPLSRELTVSSPTGVPGLTDGMVQIEDAKTVFRGAHGGVPMLVSFEPRFVAFVYPAIGDAMKMLTLVGASRQPSGGWPL